jgi:hypothetical protein
VLWLSMDRNQSDVMRVIHPTDLRQLSGDS